MLHKLAGIGLLALVTGCVTHYYPARVADDGVYYAADDWRHAQPAARVVAADYAYYPWWSLDYFYFGSGYYGSTVSIGIGYGYRPWSPWYGYHYPYYYPPYAYAWYSPFWHHHHHWYPTHRYYAHGSHKWKRHYDDVARNRYEPQPARQASDFRRDRVGDRVPRDYEDRYVSGDRNARGLAPARRETALPGDSTDRAGMRVRSNADSKPGIPRTHQAGPAIEVPGQGERSRDGVRIISDSRRSSDANPVPASPARYVSPGPSARSGGTFSVISTQRPEPRESHTPDRDPGPSAVQRGSITVTNPAPASGYRQAPSAADTSRSGGVSPARFVPAPSGPSSGFVPRTGDPGSPAAVSRTMQAPSAFQPSSARTIQPAPSFSAPPRPASSGPPRTRSRGSSAATLDRKPRDDDKADRRRHER